MSLLYAGLDVSLEMTSICVGDADGRFILEAKVASEPEAIMIWLVQLDCIDWGRVSRLKFR